MRHLYLSSLIVALLCNTALAQPPGITMEMITRALPPEGAPLAEPGPYEVASEGAYHAPRYLTFHPTDLSAFPQRDIMPLMIWGNGGCNIDGSNYGEFLSTIASHGFLVMTTTRLEDDAERRQQNDDDLLGAIAWADAENKRPGSPLNGKIDTSQIAVMGQSCGGFLSISLGSDPRVTSIGVFNSGVETPEQQGPDSPFPTTDALAELHGPALFINGHEVDFMMEASHDNFTRLNHVPTFYGARDNAGHTATVFHPGGGEYANVASNWLRYFFKGDKKAGAMFAGEECGLCRDPNWDTEAKGL